MNSFTTTTPHRHRHHHHHHRHDCRCGQYFHHHYSYTVCLTILTSFQNDRALRLSPITALCGSKGGAMVTALASHQCGPGSNLGVLLVLFFAPGSFCSDAPVSSLPSKTNTCKFLKTPECFVGEQITKYNFTLVYNTN